MIVVTRDYDSITGTHGTMSLNGRLYHTLEPPDLGNQPFASCVPLGEYVLLPFDSPKYGETYIMVNPDLNVYRFEDDPRRPENSRYLCLFVHKGNEVENFVGCMGASHKFDKDNDRLLPSTVRACREVVEGVKDEGSYRLQIRHQFE